ncbi:MAG: M20/M25/M40 family metallo-hydrolase [Simkania negevensis]|nr:M20/M25/M40 family metallo-hydrolase [Simkania negevensis]
MIKETREWVKKNQEETLRDFFTLLKFKSISTDPAFKQEVANCALWLKGYLEKLGLKAEVWATQGHPTLFASHLKAGPSRPTLLLYHHYDVQPVDPLELWTSDPFQPEIREGNVYARGAVDSKGQCFYTMTALKAFFQLAGSLNFNLKIVIEGEEEIGSPGLLQLLKTKKEFLKADACLVVDVDLLGKENPAITLGIRGVMSMEVEAMTM